MLRIFRAFGLFAVRNLFRSPFALGPGRLFCGLKWDPLEGASHSISHYADT